MEKYHLFIAKMSGDIEYNETFNLSIKNLKKIYYGFKAYDNKLSSNVERMILYDLDIIDDMESENINSIKKKFYDFIKLCRKYPTCYWYISKLNIYDYIDYKKIF